MPRLITAAPALIALVAPATEAAPTAGSPAPLPHTAVVHAESARVFSGPGEQYYQTGAVAAGEEVEVHRVVGDFVGVRPPDGSFSWVPGVDIADAGPGAGRVLRDGTPCRVGSVTSDLRNVVHVRLQRGERVRVLARVMADGAEWVHIAPPAGEFRWLRAADLHEPSVADEPPVQAPATDESLAAAPDEPAEPAEFFTEAAPLTNWVQAAAHDEPAPIEPPDETEARVSQAPATAPAAVNPATEKSPPAPASPAASSFADVRASLEVMIARRVSQSPTLWTFGDLRVEAARLQALAGPGEEQAAARALSARIARFAEIAKRQQAIAAVLRDRPQIPAPPAPAPPLVAQPTVPAPPLVGELRPVVSQHADAPKFALVDTSGQVITFLSPTPGMDLQGLLGKQVTVSGSRGYLPAIGKPHVAATRVAQAPPAMVR